MTTTELWNMGPLLSWISCKMIVEGFEGTKLTIPGKWE